MQSKKSKNTTASLKGDIPIKSRYTAGIAQERFFREFQKNQRIVGSTCPKCRKNIVPAVLFCEECLSRTKEFNKVPQTGKVYAYTCARIDIEGKRLKKPSVIAIIKFKNVHGGLVHQLGDISPSDIKIGMEVAPVWKSKKERKGTITDIKYFKPV